MPGKNKMIYFFVLLSLLCSGQANFAQTADYRALSRRPDVVEGVSEPHRSEAAALRDAINSAYYTIAASICSFVSGITGIRIVLTGQADNTEVTVSAVADARVSFRMQLTGTRELARHVEKTDDGYFIARVLITISPEGRDRAKRYIDHETTAIRAYRYFASKFNLVPLNLNDVPVGFPDYISWLDANSIIFQMREGRSDSYLTHLDIFLRKFNRTIVSFADKLDNKSVLIIYKSADYYQEITSALQKTGFTAYRENSKIWLNPHISLEEFARRVMEMPDSGGMNIAGIGCIDNRFTQINPAALYEIARIAGQKGMQAQVVSLPDQYQKGIYNDTQIVNMLANKTARYTLLLKSTLTPEPLVSFANVTPPHFSVIIRIMVLDSLLDKIIYSDSVKDVGSYSVANVRVEALRPIVTNILDNL